MKKLLISIIIILVLILTGITIINGLEIGKFEILGITEIKKQNENLDDQIKEATKLASTDYPKTLDDLNRTLKEFENTKAKYEEKVSISTDTEIQAANQISVYEIGKLWIKLGNHAKSEGLTMDLYARDLKLEKDNKEQNKKIYNCNLYFTVIGTYAGIAGFVEDIEDDSELGFRIEDFKITTSSEGNNVLQATFNCKDIRIDTISTNSETTNANLINPTAIDGTNTIQ